MSALADSDIQAVDLKVEYLVNPFSVDITQPRLQWTLQALNETKKDLSQKAYQILVATDRQSLDKNIGNLWDSKKVVSDRTNHIKYGGTPLKAGMRAYWKVNVWDQNDRVLDKHPGHIGFWDKGLDASDWTAQWIGAPKGTQQQALKNLADIDANLIKSKPGLVPVLYLRKSFTTNSKVKSAKLYATAQGAYKLAINGRDINKSVLDPGWTDYNKTIQYQAYDVTDQLAAVGKSAISVLLGTGWFGSYVGFSHQYNIFGWDQNLLVELRIEYEDKTTAVVKSDNTWKVNTGSYIYSDLLMGELYYESREPQNWRDSAFDDSHWPSVVTKPIDKNVALVADRAEPVRVTQTLEPKNKRQVKPGVWIFDFEQNMVGWVQLNLPKAYEASRVQLRHAEVLNPDGTIYTLNLRSALATDTYVLNKANRPTELSLEPHFTTHGFRYVEITGYPGEPPLTAIKGIVMHSDTAFKSHFETSNKMVNKLHSNINWGQRGNFLSVPTDCPQRDERLGWTGDAEIFAQTATYNADVSAFYTKWMRDLRDGQSKEGGFPDVAPRVVDGADGSPAWGDVGVIVPYTVWRQYGDLEIIKENYESMKRWMTYIESQNPNFLWTSYGDLEIIKENYESMKRWMTYIESQNPNFLWTKRVNNNFGDWLQVNADTPKEILSTAYYGYDALLLSKMAKALDFTQDAKRYGDLHQNIANAFVKAFVNTTDGRMKGDTQTDYVIAIAFEMLPKNLQPLAAQHLVDNIKAHDYHLTTGFVGVGHLCPTLSQFGHSDVAYRLLLQDTYPSWGYSIKYNATTIWERWDGWTKEKGFQDPGMNSFNHYSLGSVGRWLYQSVAGIDTDNEKVGFKLIIIAPKPAAGLTSVKAHYPSINGLIGSAWETNGVNITLTIDIPVNTKAVIDLTFLKSAAVENVGSGSAMISLADSDIQAVDLKVEYLVNPLAVDITQPRLQWTLQALNETKQNLSQKAYQILVATDRQSLDKNIGNLWDSKKVVSDRTNHIKYGGTPLKAGMRAYWKVNVWDQNDRVLDKHPGHIGFWDKGLDASDWTAQWIGAPKGTQQQALKNIADIDAKLIKSKPGLVPVLYLRKSFTTNSKVKSAKLYATAQGVYKLAINGRDINKSILDPGWTDYHKTIQYQAYDVTYQLTATNTISVLLGTGWYSSYVSFFGQYNLFGTDQNLLIELRIEYEDKTTAVVKSDNTWKVSTGSYIYSDLLMGELYYESREPQKWRNSTYDDSHWLSVVTNPIDKNVALVADRAEPVRATQVLEPKTKHESQPGVWVFDFDQNMVGWVQIQMPKAYDASRVQLRHAEALNPNGTIYVLNLRSALATDTYVLNKANRTTDLSLEPHFTTHGFRYVEVTGYPGEPPLSAIKGIVIHSDTAFKSHFETSNKMVNQLYSNINWGQKGNFLSVPTDCPQRDERLGWTGDAEIFAHTATYNADVSAFYTKWMRDLRDSQSKEGGFPEVAPRLSPDGTDGAPAWGDVGVIVPYTVWRQYGDLQTVEDNYESMKLWMTYIESQNPNFLWTKRVNNNFGDWLQVNADTPKDVLSTAYYGYDALLLSKMAKALGRTQDVKRYGDLHQNIANAFVKAFVNTTDGRMKGDTQTDYVIAIAFEMLPKNLQQLAANHLVDNIKAHDYHLTTGFVGVGHLCPTLSQFGHSDVAYRLLLQDTYPSWGYSIKYNATTIWERWD
ncbi:unnamed protein product, partial [Medioppia subpectinata]